MKLSQLDIRILTELQRNADQTNLALAEKVGLSPPACLKRVHKLKSSGAIQQIIAVVDPDIFGPRMNMIVEIEMHTDELIRNREFIQAANDASEVKQCYKVTGEVDFIIIVNVADIFEYERFCQRVLYAHKNMKKFTTFASMSCTKLDLSHPLT